MGHWHSLAVCLSVYLSLRYFLVFLLPIPRNWQLAHLIRTGWFCCWCWCWCWCCCCARDVSRGPPRWASNGDSDWAERMVWPGERRDVTDVSISAAGPVETLLIDWKTSYSFLLSFHFRIIPLLPPSIPSFLLSLLLLRLLSIIIIIISSLLFGFFSFLFNCWMIDSCFDGCFFFYSLVDVVVVVVVVCFYSVRDWAAFAGNWSPRPLSTRETKARIPPPPLFLSRNDVIEWKRADD